MKLRTRTIASIIGVTAVTLGLAAPAAHASNPARYNICTTGSVNQCLNNTAGRATNGNIIQFWAYGTQGEPNNDWHYVLQGYVSNGGKTGIWPFTDGSGLNNRYDGLPVYQLQWSQNLNFCADQTGYNPADEYGDLELSTCNAQGSVTDYQMFVYTGEDFWPSVYASNIQYTYYETYDAPVWLGASGGTAGDHNGSPVIMTPFQDDSLPMSINVASIQ
ncbi:MAG TPA: hypothetical protein VGH27_32640 [Streptosporangiaceae bacterium]|jgi:hypothetical protein